MEMYESAEKFICFDMQFSDHLGQWTTTDSLFQTDRPLKWVICLNQKTPSVEENKIIPQIWLHTKY